MKRRLAAGALASLILLTGCSAPPVTTHKQADGSILTLNWADYPGHAYFEPSDILATPDAEQIEAHGRLLLETIRTEVAAEVGIDLEFLDGEARFDELASNGYGNPTLLTSFSCCSLLATAVPANFADWTRVYQIVARVSKDFGAGPMIREQDQPEFKGNPEHEALFEETWGTGTPGEYSLLSAWTTGSGQTVWLTIEDPARRPGASDAEKANEPRMSVDYSATVLQAGNRAEFIERLAPFDGAARPDSTEWD